MKIFSYKLDVFFNDHEDQMQGHKTKMKVFKSVVRTESKLYVQVKPR